MEGPDSGAATETVTRTKRQLILHAALVVLVSGSGTLLQSLIDAVEAAMHRALASMPRAPIISASLAKRGALVQVRDLAALRRLAES